MADRTVVRLRVRAGPQHTLRAPWLVLLLVASCARGAEPGAAEPGAADAPWFREEAAARSLVFTWHSGHEEKHYFPEIMGGGVALFDLEEDGDLDAYFVQAGSILAPAKGAGNQLFVNGGDAHFTDRTAGSGADVRGYGMGVAAGDADEDGRTDLYVTNVGPNVLLRNQGDGSLADVTAAAGVGDPAWSASAAFCDYDRDGDLDLFVANYLLWSVAGEKTCSSKPYPEDYCAPSVYDTPAPDTLYRNLGAGRFEDVSLAAGVRAADGNGLGVVCSDFDGDGWTDVFVANDGMLNQLWKNRGDGTFVDVAVNAGCALDQDGHKKAGMGTVAGDLDCDGDEDLLVCNLLGEADSYFRNDGLRFSDRTKLVGLAGASRSFTRFGVGLCDFDNDGLLDLYQANGHVVRHTEPSTPEPYDEPNLLYRLVRSEAAGGRPSSPRFEEVTPRGGTQELLVATSRAAAFGDLDGDGGVDIVVVNRDRPAYLLMNRATRGAWIAFRAREKSGRDALGARLRLQVGADETVRVVRSAYGYCAANAAIVHVGLGAATSGVERVEVTWADGMRETFAAGYAAGAVHELPRDPQR